MKFAVLKKNIRKIKLSHSYFTSFVRLFLSVWYLTGHTDLVIVRVVFVAERHVLRKPAAVDGDVLDRDAGRHGIRNSEHLKAFVRDAFRIHSHVT